MTDREEDSDETEGRKLYRGQAETLARLSVNMVARRPKMTKREKLDGRYVCKCECGGQVRGIEQFGRLWTWCEKCTPKAGDAHGECERPAKEDGK